MDAFGEAVEVDRQLGATDRIVVEELWPQRACPARCGAGARMEVGARTGVATVLALRFAVAKALDSDIQDAFPLVEQLLQKARAAGHGIIQKEMIGVVGLGQQEQLQILSLYFEHACGVCVPPLRNYLRRSIL